MPFTLDHIFVAASPGAPQADRLREFGLTDGEPNRHCGQGTANRRFFFRNAMLELLWIEDTAEVKSAAVRRTGLWERLSGDDKTASPFGVCLRPAGASTTPPFSSWEYRPPYLPEPLAIHIADGAPLAEPLWFYINFGRRADEATDEQRQPLDHPAGLKEITGVVIESPGTEPLSAAGQAVVQSGVVTVRRGERHLLELQFDRRAQGARNDFRPDLPLVFCW